MNHRFEQSLLLKGIFSREDRKVTIIFLVGTFLIVTWRYFGTTSFYLTSLVPTFPFLKADSFSSSLYLFGTAFILFGVVPIAVIRFVFHEPLAQYGLQLGDWKFGIASVLILAPVMLLLTYPVANDPAYIAEYPINRTAGASSSAFLLHAFCYGFYYIGYEILMRGFIQFGIRDAIGDWYAILVQTAISCLFHIGKPAGEIYSAILGGLVWGIVAFRSRSLLYVLIVHWILGVSMDFFICFGR
ncbi:MAG: CPBP family intramembrane metalloprotease [Bacteroidetes bacterium]|nr:CPBP family intramembrane metalloprotease [Bacteroidota bacterium]